MSHRLNKTVKVTASVNLVQPGSLAKQPSNELFSCCQSHMMSTDNMQLKLKYSVQTVLKFNSMSMAYTTVPEVG